MLSVITDISASKNKQEASKESLKHMAPLQNIDREQRADGRQIYTETV